MSCLRAVVVVGAILLLGGVSSADDGEIHNAGWYAGLAAGLSIAPDPVDSSGTVTSGTNTYSYSDTLSTNPGFVVMGQAGYKLRSGWRFDAEVSYRRNAYDRFDEASTGSFFGGPGVVRSTPLDGSISSVAYMVDVWYELQIARRWMPYVGIGIGGVTTITDVPPLVFVPIPDSHTDFGFQLGAGVGYALDDKTVLTLDYRYVESLDAEGILFIFTDYLDYRTHNVMLGVRRHFSFGG